jgi:hypothetical protein
MSVHFVNHGVSQSNVLADGAAALQAAYAGRVPALLLDENVRRLSEPGALSATLNWYRALTDNLSYPAGRVAVPTRYVWGSEDRALGREAALLTGGFVDGPTVSKYSRGQVTGSRKKRRTGSSHCCYPNPQFLDPTFIAS